MLLRPRLLDRLNTTAALTVLFAPCGYGKTTLAAQWAEHSDRTGLWVTFGADIETAEQLNARLVAELSACGWLEHSSAPDAPPFAWDDPVRQYASGQGARPTLIFDNVDAIGPEAVTALAALQAVLASAIDCVWLTRQAESSWSSDRSISELRGQSAINVINDGDLLLTEAEVAALLEPLAGSPRYDELLELIEGVPLAAGTAVIAYQQSNELFTANADPAGSRLSWVRSVLPGLADASVGMFCRDAEFGEFADFLTAISTAPALDPPLASELSGLPAPRSRYFLVHAVESGFGHWAAAADGDAPIFRYSPDVRLSLQSDGRRSADTTLGV